MFFNSVYYEGSTNPPLRVTKPVAEKIEPQIFGLRGMVSALTLLGALNFPQGRLTVFG